MTLHLPGGLGHIHNLLVSGGVNVERGTLLKMASSRSSGVKVVVLLLVPVVLLLMSLKAVQAISEFSKTSLGPSSSAASSAQVVSAVSAVKCWVSWSIVRGAEYCAEIVPSVPSPGLAKVTSQY